MLVSQLYLHVSGCYWTVETFMVTTNLRKHKKTWRHHLIIMTSESQIYDLLSHHYCYYHPARCYVSDTKSDSTMNVRSSGGKHTLVQEQLNQHGMHEYKVMHQTEWETVCKANIWFSHVLVCGWYTIGSTSFYILYHCVTWFSFINKVKPIIISTEGRSPSVANHILVAPSSASTVMSF